MPFFYSLICFHFLLTHLVLFCFLFNFFFTFYFSFSLLLLFRHLPCFLLFLTFPFLSTLSFLSFLILFFPIPISFHSLYFFMVLLSTTSSSLSPIFHATPLFHLLIFLLFLSIISFPFSLDIVLLHHHPLYFYLLFLCTL